MHSGRAYGPTRSGLDQLNIITSGLPQRRGDVAWAGVVADHDRGRLRRTSTNSGSDVRPCQIDDAGLTRDLGFVLSYAASALLPVATTASSWAPARLVRQSSEAFGGPALGLTWAEPGIKDGVPIAA